MSNEDEICECGHIQLAHDRTEGCLADKLNCLRPEPCECMKFTPEEPHV